MNARVAEPTVIPPPIGGLPAAERQRLKDALHLRLGRLEARLTEAASAGACAPVGGADDALLQDALGGVLATVDALDAHLSDVEAWANQIAGEHGLFIGAARDRHRAEFGLPPFGQPEARG